MQIVDVVVIGAGAAGCFGAIQAAHHFPNATIVILERGSHPLAKVKISGGGRCNVTNSISEPNELSKCYPRGERFLKKAFYSFSSNHMKEWLEDHKVPLKLYNDGCYFPESNDSQTIIDCFLNELKRKSIEIKLNCRVDLIEQNSNHWKIQTAQGLFEAKSVLITTGGQPKLSGFQLFSTLKIPVVAPLPSLFTFNMPNEPIRDLMGIVAEHASVRIAGEKWTSTGPLLITHWGMSGPAVLKCSAFGARILADKGYESTILVNWSGSFQIEEVRQVLENNRLSNKLITNLPPFGIKTRLWEYLVVKSGIDPTSKWSDLGPKQTNRLQEIVFNDAYQMSGKTTFKEEFVTAGGVDLSEIDVKTMQSKSYPGLFFAGEVMDIDGITGGFNFQAAWTTAYIAGKSILVQI